MNFENYYCVTKLAQLDKNCELCLSVLIYEYASRSLKKSELAA